MENLTDKLYAFAVPKTHGELAEESFPPYRIRLVAERHDYLMSDEAIKLEEVSVDFDLPDITHTELVNKAIDTLKDKQVRARNDAEDTIERLQEKINRLLALPPPPPTPDHNDIDHMETI